MKMKYSSGHEREENNRREPAGRFAKLLRHLWNIFWLNPNGDFAVRQLLRPPELARRQDRSESRHREPRYSEPAVAADVVGRPIHATAVPLALRQRGRQRRARRTTQGTETKEAGDTGEASGARSVWSLFAWLMPENDAQTACEERKPTAS